MDYKTYNGEVVQNKYGSAFMVKKSLGDNDFELYLAAISYYSAPNSQMFKLLNITFNEDCFALNQDSYFEITPED